MEALPLEPRRFDLVIAPGSLHQASRLSRALVELRRVTRRGGVLLALDSPVFRRREDGEAVSRIEKLVGHKIPRAGGVPAPASDPAEPAAEQSAKPARTQKPKPERRRTAKRPDPAKADDRPKAAERAPETAPAEGSPVVEDIEGEWNGPLPSFLSVSAG